MVHRIPLLSRDARYRGKKDACYKRDEDYKRERHAAKEIHTIKEMHYIERDVH